MKLSIVMPTLDEGEVIENTLSALQGFRQLGVEIVLVDGGSQDQTQTLARPWVDQLVIAPPGRASQMNAGAKAAQGDVLLFLHADTQLPAGGIAQISRATEQGAGWGRFDVRISGRARTLGLVSALMNARSRLTAIATGDQAIFVSRTLFEKVGGFPLQALMEDIELSKRLRQLERPHCLAGPAVTSGRRWEKRGVWKTIFLMWRLRWLYWRGVSPARLAEKYR